MSTAEKSLLRFTEAWDKAMTGNNAAEIAGFMHDDWTITGSDGITSKAAFLQSVTSGDLVHNRMDTDEVVIKIFGDTGLVIAKGTSEGTYKLQPFSFYEWSTSVFIKLEEKWLCISTMLTPAK